MNYFLIKLKFSGQIHFGTGDSALSLYFSDDHFRADTLFSALCHTALDRGGEGELNRLCELVQDGNLLLSDSMPWRDEEYYLPRPFFTAQESTQEELPPDLRKAIKKLTWIPVSAFSVLERGDVFDPSRIDCHFGDHVERTSAWVQEGADALPYQIGAYQFHEACGLYILAAVNAEEDGKWLITLMERLGLGGIGGKISAGYGSFEVEDSIFLDEPFDDSTRWLYERLSGDYSTWLLLTSSLPAESEIETALSGASFQMVRRGGFVASDVYASTSRKKRTQYYLAAGSVLRNRFAGDLYNVGSDGVHPVYRYAKPLMLGVKL